MWNRMSFRLSWLLCFVLLGACGDVTKSNGEFNRVSYSLYTTYLVDESSLTEVSLLIGYDQRINTSLTVSGASETEEPFKLLHKISPDASINVFEDGFDVPDMTLKVTSPGEYTLETTKGDDVFDRIKLNFDVPASLDPIVWVRAEGAEEFTKSGSNADVSVEVGDQVTFLPVPVDASGERLLGDLETEISLDNPGLAVAVENVHGVYEQRVWSSSMPVSLIFVEEGTLVVTLKDVVNNVETNVNFTVSVPAS